MSRSFRPALIIACALAPLSAPAAEGSLRFNRDVRPILSDTCFQCHGPDVKARKAGMRLDLAAEAVKPAKSGALPIVPGKPDESEVVKRIFTKDHDDLMPPEEAHKTLTEAQKNILRQWIAEGAVYEAHWSYTPLRRPEVPKTTGPAATEIDSFLLERLEKSKLAFSSPAAPEELCRRLHLDLVGLPPSPAEVAEFVRQAGVDRPKAVAAKVDALLASPHFGERWASWWLDVAHFTDTVGFHGDQNQRIFPYRDYVIDAFNANKRFDQFTLEQLAGDLIPNATVEQKVASGFNRLNMMTREGGAQAKEYLAKYGAERTRTVAITWLGSTFGCAECHDHKYDPILARDFYSLQSFFADLKQWGVYSDYGYTPNPDLRGWSNEHPFPPEIQVESPALKRREAKLRKQIADSATSQEPAEAPFTQWVSTVSDFIAKHPDGWTSPVPAVETSAPPVKKPKKPKAAAPAAKTNPTPKVPAAPATPPPAAAAPAPAAAAPAPAVAAPAAPPPAPEPPEPPFTVEADGRIVFDKGAADNTKIRLKPDAGWLAAIRVELLPHEDHKGGILRTGAQGAAALKITASLQKAGAPKETPLAFHFADASHKEARYSNGFEIIGIRDVWRTSAKNWKESHTGVGLLDQPVAIGAGDVLTIQLADNTAGCVRVSISPFAPSTPSQLCEGKWIGGIKTALTAAATPSRSQLAEAYLTSTGWNRDAFAKYKKIFMEIAECHGGKTWSMISEPREPITVRVLPRGNWMDESGPVVQPQAPHFLPQISNPENRRLTRLDFAKWLCSNDNPLTARTVVNRLWKQFFGNGLSIVIDDLGAQGEPPTHPELLDWLSLEFRDHGWDFKRLVRQIVTSSAYAQRASLRPELRDLDPNNRLLASQNPRRLDAEFVRDNALAVSGLLNLEMGGPSVKPYQPGGYYESLQFPSRDYEADLDDRQWRRGVYMHWQRTFLHPMLANFDAPMRDECAATRVFSNTPQQALTLLNDPTFAEASRVFAQKLLQLNADDAGRINTAFQRAVARAPKAKESESLIAFLAKQREYFRAHPEDAAKAVRAGIAPQAPGIDPAELASWSAVCRVVLNLHETITRY